MFQNVNISEGQTIHGFFSSGNCIAMRTNVNRMSNIRHKDRIRDCDIAGIAVISVAMIVDSNGIIARAHKHIINSNVFTTEQIYAIGPFAVTESFEVADSDVGGLPASQTPATGVTIAIIDNYDTIYC